MPSSAKVLHRMDTRLAELSSSFVHFVSVFAESEKFSGPSLYFHHRTIDCLRRHDSAAHAIGSDEIFDWLYATLASWGMHRMGKGNTKLLELQVIKESLRSQRNAVAVLQDISILNLPPSALRQVCGDIWRLLSSLTISIADAQIVANSKVLHHLLPRLLPPIDRTYTFNFFYNRNNLSISEADAFTEMYSRFHHVALHNKDAITALVGTGWNTSETKVIDNAIVGYVIEVLHVLET